MPVTIGRYEYTLDAKNRLVVPARYREMLAAEKGAHFILSLGVDGCLWLFLPSQWEMFLDDMKEHSKGIKDKTQARALKRQLYSRAVEAPLDDQGRILIPLELKSEAGVKKDVMITGAGNKAEIWDRKAWAKYADRQAKPSFEKLAKDIDL
jgi:MraZ protein